MMDVEGRPRVVHPVSSYIDYSKDKQGFTQVTIVINLILTITIIIFILTIIIIILILSTTTIVILMKMSQASLRLPSWVKVDPLPPTPESELLPAGTAPILVLFSPSQTRLKIQFQVWTGAIVGPRMGALQVTHRQ